MLQRGLEAPLKFFCLSLFVLCCGALAASALTLGGNSLIFGRGSGDGTLVVGGSWTASTGASWIHISTPSGDGSELFRFTYDTNPGATRTGTISFNNGAARLTVTQAGEDYVAATRDVTTLVSSGLTSPVNLALDSTGNIYVVDRAGLKKWTAATGQVTTLASAGLNGPQIVAVDSAGNAYVADLDGIKKWTASTGKLTVLVSAPTPELAGVDAEGNMFFRAGASNGIKRMSAATGQVTTLVPSVNSTVFGMTVDRAGNLYFFDADINAPRKWTAATGQVTTILTPGVSYPEGVKVDAAGNLYFLFRLLEVTSQAVQEWVASTGQVTTLGTPKYGLYYSNATVDQFGNLYVVSSVANSIYKILRAFTGPQVLAEPFSAGSDQLAPVLPANTPLHAVSDQPWLTITGYTDGAVHFSFTGTTTPRTAHITVLGRVVTVTQAEDVLPTVVSFETLWGQEAYTLTGSKRHHLPWQISGIRVVFSKPIAFGDTASLSGVAATALAGLGTNTLTWTIDPLTLGTFQLALAQSGVHALRDASGTPLSGYASQALNVLYGDANDDGAVNAGDLALVNSARTSSYDLFSDLNGDDWIDGLDMQIVRGRIGATLP